MIKKNQNNVFFNTDATISYLSAMTTSADYRGDLDSS